MEVILLERIEKLGQMGDVVDVKPGYARNFLLPQKKALRATGANMAHFESQRAQLEAVNLDRRNEAEAVGAKLDGLSVILVRQAGEAGQLYGSVTSRDIAGAVTEAGFTVARQQVRLERPIKAIGLHSVHVALHPEVTVTVTANVARSQDEAEIQERTGEAVIAAEEGAAVAEEAEAAPEAEELMEETAVEALHEREAEEAAAEAEEEAVAEAAVEKRTAAAARQTESAETGETAEAADDDTEAENGGAAPEGGETPEDDKDEA
jgi:large subunit ribosomal protein L9